MTTPPEAAREAAQAAIDARWMTAALALARRGLGETWPNPSVGCVLVDREGRLVARGRTQAGGRPHAEAAAIAAALAQPGGAARLCGATAYVTLEPCSHHGRTPPCAEALVAADVARVVVALEDPDPRVAGRGLARLAAAGIAVQAGLRAEAAAEVLGGYLSRQAAGRPRLTLKLAASLDGRIATATGESRWITGESARRRVHLLRAASDAVLVGAGTARADDPMLDVRLDGLGARRTPVRVIADPSLSLPSDGRLARSAAAQPLWLAHGPAAAPARRAALARLGAELIETETGPEGLAPSALLQALGARGLTDVLCEGGGALAASLLRAGLVDRLIWVIAGAALGAEGRASLGPLALEALAEAPRFERVAAAAEGADLWTEWRPRR